MMKRNDVGEINIPLNMKKKHGKIQTQIKDYQHSKESSHIREGCSWEY